MWEVEGEMSWGFILGADKLGTEILKEGKMKRRVWDMLGLKSMWVGAAFD